MERWPRECNQARLMVGNDDWMLMVKKTARGCMEGPNFRRRGLRRTLVPSYLLRGRVSVKKLHAKPPPGRGCKPIPLPWYSHQPIFPPPTDLPSGRHPTSTSVRAARTGCTACTGAMYQHTDLPHYVIAPPVSGLAVLSRALAGQFELGILPLSHT